MDTEPRRYRPHKTALVLGCLALAVAVALAHRSPATGYELSIYRATPTTYWLGVVVATPIALWLAATTEGRLRDGAHLLLAGAVLSVMALPAIRSYAFYGTGDALTHLGWAREMYAGVLSPLDNLYPGVHLVAIFLQELTGVDLARALLLLPVALFPLVFVVFVALTVGVVTTGRWAITVGLGSALLFVPVNLVSNHPIVHPSTQTILFVPLVLYLLFRYVEAPAGLGTLTAPSGAALAVASLALVLYHPQESMNLLAILLAVAALQRVVRRVRPDHQIAEHRGILAHTVLVGVAFLAWTFQHERARARLGYVADSFVASGPQTLEQTGSRAASLQALGGTVEEIVLKLFGVAIVFGLLSAMVLYASLSGSLEDEPTTNQSLIGYLGAGLVPLGALFAIVFLADQGDHYFRFLGFMLVPITVLGAVAISVGVDQMSTDLDRRTVAMAIVVGFALMVPLQALVFHHSPYVYQGNQQVTEGAIEGHENAFEYRDDEVVMMGIRGGHTRYVDATYGSHTARSERNFAGYRSSVPGRVFSTNLTRHYDEDRYLVTSDSDYATEVELYRGLRYADRGFQTLRTDASVARVHSNGDVELYRIEGSG